MENGNLKIVKLSGGLGNQLFQYFFGQYLKKRFSCNVKYFNEIGQKPLKSINAFFPNINYCNSHDLNNCNYLFKSHLLYRIERKLLLLFPKLCERKLVENGSKYQENISNNTQVFDGYWQSYKYLDAESITLTNNISLNNNVTKLILETNSVFVHVRRGDYLKGKNKGIFEVCSIQYFKKAIELLTNKLKNPTFFIFSNDIKWAKENLKINKSINLHFVYNKGENSDITDFLQMLHCKHGIISNSTFSWWAAWLIENKSKNIVAPKDWYKSQKMNSTINDLIPETWTRI